MYRLLTILQCLAQTPEQVLSIQIGHPQAKLPVYMYISFTCTHCADFFTCILPNLHSFLEERDIVFFMRLGSFTSVDPLIAYGFSFVPSSKYLSTLKEFFAQQEKIIIYAENRLDYVETSKRIVEFFKDHGVTFPEKFRVNSKGIVCEEPIKDYERHMIENSSVILQGKVLAFPSLFLKKDPQSDPSRKAIKIPENLGEWKDLIQSHGRKA